MGPLIVPAARIRRHGHAGVARRHASFFQPYGRPPMSEADVLGGGGDRDGRLRIAALTNVRAVVRVLGSASLRADAVDRRRAPFRVGSIWGNMFRSMTSRPSRQSADLLTANDRVCTSRMPCALTAILLPESLAHGCHMLQTWFPSGRSWVCTWRGAWNRGGGGEANWHAL